MNKYLHGIYSVRPFFIRGKAAELEGETSDNTYVPCRLKETFASADADSIICREVLFIYPQVSMFWEARMQIRNWLSRIGTAPSRVPRVALARIGREQRWSPSKNDLGALCDYGVRFTRGPKGTSCYICSCCHGNGNVYGAGDTDRSWLASETLQRGVRPRNNDLGLRIDRYRVPSGR